MKLEIFDKHDRTRLGIIRIYDYVSYTDELRGYGSFKIEIPTNEETIEYLVEGNYIWFEDNIVGVIKGISDTEEKKTKITVYGYLLNYLLTYRSNLNPYKKYGKVGNVFREMFTDLFVNPEDTKRKINWFKLSDDIEDLDKFPDSKTFQNTGDTFLDACNETFEPYGLGYELIPVFSITNEEGEYEPCILNMEYRIITPHNRTFGNEEDNNPIVFSFDLNNLSKIEFEEDSTQYLNYAYVASEGEGEERKHIEAGDVDSTGIDRMELYVDARDIQSDSDPENPLTNEELEELMISRGNEKLAEHIKVINFSASLDLADKKYIYGQDYYKGDYVAIIDERTNRKYELQITEVTKTISKGVEHFDVEFGVSKIDILKKKERRIYNVYGNKH